MEYEVPEMGGGILGGFIKWKILITDELDITYNIGGSSNGRLQNHPESYHSIEYYRYTVCTIN